MPDAESDAGLADRRRVERAIQSLIDSPIGNRCVTCGHVKHNELGYCQNGQCICGDGTTVAGLAGIIRRDLTSVLSPASGSA
jgi:hypothetical protein